MSDVGTEKLDETEDDEDDDEEWDGDDTAEEGQQLAEDLYEVQTWLTDWESQQMTLDNASEVIGDRLPDWVRSELEEAWNTIQAGLGRMEAVVGKMLDVLIDKADEEGWQLPDRHYPARLGFIFGDENDENEEVEDGNDEPT